MPKQNALGYFENEKKAWNCSVLS